MAIAGTHSINYRIPKDSKMGNLKMNASIKFDEYDYSHQKGFGTDTWDLKIGLILDQLLEEVNPEVLDAENYLIIKNLQVLSFKKGLLQWSTHRVELEFDYDVVKNEQVVKSDTISDSGEGSGKEFGGLTYVPIAGNINFDKGIEVAVYRALENCLFKLQDRWHKD